MERLASIFIERHSGRAYDSSRPVTQEQILMLIEAARAAPSCYNDQPWFFIICNSSTHPDAYQRAFECLVEGNQAWAKEAPLLVIVLAGSKFHKNGKPNRWGAYDAGAAALSMAMEATFIGLMVHQMGGFDENKVKRDFSIPEDVTPMAVMAIGYEKQNEDIPPKERLPLRDNFFMGSWNNF